jgi:hypothetical protein
MRIWMMMMMMMMMLMVHSSVRQMCFRCWIEELKILDQVFRIQNYNKRVAALENGKVRLLLQKTARQIILVLYSRTAYFLQRDIGLNVK